MNQKKIKYSIIIAVSFFSYVTGMGERNYSYAERENFPSILMTPNDTVNTLKRNALLARQKGLQQELDQELKKREQMSFNDVAPMTVERLKERQDSICLDLKSRLVTVQLEINELEKKEMKNRVQAILDQKENESNK